MVLFLSKVQIEGSHSPKDQPLYDIHSHELSQERDSQQFRKKSVFIDRLLSKQPIQSRRVSQYQIAHQREECSLAWDLSVSHFYLSYKSEHQWPTAELSSLGSPSISNLAIASLNETDFHTLQLPWPYKCFSHHRSSNTALWCLDVSINTKSQFHFMFNLNVHLLQLFKCLLSLKLLLCLIISLRPFKLFQINPILTFASQNQSRLSWNSSFECKACLNSPFE